MNIACLIEIMAALRTPGTGCPWDLEQDFRSIAPYTIEEAYEVADAIARRIVPSGTAVDGDIVFACSAGTAQATAMQVEQMARAATEMAIERAVRMAKGRDGIPGLADK